MNMFDLETPFYKILREKVKNLGGAFNAHLHLDRYGTLDEQYITVDKSAVLESSHISLQKKHSLINAIHSGPAYQEENLRQRVNEVLDVMVHFNTFRADTMVDVTDDGVGVRAMEIMRDIKQKRMNEIELNLASYSPFGFCDDKPKAWELFKEASKYSDFIGALPEADDVDDYPSHIGFMEHCKRVLELAIENHQELHVHTDQRNEPSETGTERLIEAVKNYGAPVSQDGEPMVWAVHMISPSTYDEARFQRLVEGLLAYNIGVICCPSAGVGMRQYRTIETPTYNSIPRVLELLAAGVRVRIASDNIADICSPSTTADWADEIFILSAAVRFYEVEILAQLASGKPLNQQQIQFIQNHLEKNQTEIDKFLNKSKR